MGKEVKQPDLGLLSPGEEDIALSFRANLVALDFLHDKYTIRPSW